MVEKLRKVLSQKIPHAAIEYCVSLWDATPFHFTISRSRSTCLGNYRYKDGQDFISVNHDLNSYNFLITYIHEVAHLRVRKKYLNAKAHGHEWQNKFTELMSPLLTSAVFPSDILARLKIHMAKPKSSTTRDLQLVQVLRKYDELEPRLILQDLEDGVLFTFRGKVFKKLFNRRTRAMIQDPTTQKKYTLSLVAEVERYH